MSDETVNVSVEHQETSGGGGGLFSSKVYRLVVALEREIAEIQDPTSSEKFGASIVVTGKREDIKTVTEDSLYVTSHRKFLEIALSEIKGYNAKVDWSTQIDPTSDTAQVIWSVVLSKPCGKP